MPALADVQSGGKAALARTLAQLEAGPDTAGAASLLDAALAATRAHVIGLTGPPGVGKSSLLDALIRDLRARGLALGVIAVDPTSRVSGGALLGDRTRLSRDPADQGVFMRSMAARDRLGGLADAAFPALVLMGAVFDLVVVETVGVGQSEIAVADVADTVVFCAQPGSGDALQFLKAGIMEIPDMVVVTKADMGEAARHTVADLKGALSLQRGQEVEVLSCSARAGDGVDRVGAALVARAEGLAPDALRRRRSAQAAAWLDAGLLRDYGRLGLARLSPQPRGESADAPFRQALRRRAEIDRRLEIAAPPR